MNPTDQRIAIAKVYGYSNFEWEVHPAITYLWGYLNGEKHLVPDYLNNRNEIHKVLTILNPCRVSKDGTYPEKSQLWYKYFTKFLLLCERYNVSSGFADCYIMAEAFLWTFELWIEDEDKRS